jgi:hypothetical protein
MYPSQSGSLISLSDHQTGLCLDSNYSNPAYPATGAVYTDPCNGGTYQQWFIDFPNEVPPANDPLTIVDNQTGLCLDSNYSNPAYPATGAVYSDPCNGGTYQQWYISEVGNGDFTIRDAQTGLCLDSNYSNPAYPSTGAVYTGPCNGGTYQNWETP